MKTKLSVIALAALLFAGLPIASSSAFVAVSVAIAPPVIPVYEQPLCPAPGYIWTPGYWAYGDVGYYWVPGIWVAPPRVGYLWTPGYWAFRGGRYVFTDGYWGPTIGFYGGINYGYGYFGHGYYGGRWVGHTFAYNTAVSRVNTTVIHNTYVNKEVVKTGGTRASFNGPNGVTAKATAAEQKAAKAPRVAPTKVQRSAAATAKSNPELRASKNNGKPPASAVSAVRNKVAPHPAAVGEKNKAATGAQTRAAKAGAANQTAADRGKKATNHVATEKTTAKKRVAPQGRHAETSTAGNRNAALERKRAATEKSTRAGRAQQQATERRAQEARSRRAAQPAHPRGPEEGQRKGKKHRPGEGPEGQ